MSLAPCKTCQWQEFLYAYNIEKWVVTCGMLGERVDDNRCIRCPHLIRVSREENCRQQQYVRQIEAHYVLPTTSTGDYERPRITSLYPQRK